MKTLFAIIGCAALASGAAFADDTLSEQSFSDLDQNRDGVLTQSEAATDQELVAHFVEADINQDGLLTVDEYDTIINGSEEMEEAE